MDAEQLTHVEHFFYAQVATNVMWVGLVAAMYAIYMLLE